MILSLYFHVQVQMYHKFIRQALHVGNLEFPNSGNVYMSMINVFMDDGREDVEFCLERYRYNIFVTSCK